MLLFQRNLCIKDNSAWPGLIWFAIHIEIVEWAHMLVCVSCYKREVYTEEQLFFWNIRWNRTVSLWTGCFLSSWVSTSIYTYITEILDCGIIYPSTWLFGNRCHSVWTAGSLATSNCFYRLLKSGPVLFGISCQAQGETPFPNEGRKMVLRVSTVNLYTHCRSQMPCNFCNTGCNRILLNMEEEKCFSNMADKNQIDIPALSPKWVIIPTFRNFWKRGSNHSKRLCLNVVFDTWEIESNIL